MTISQMCDMLRCAEKVEENIKEILGKQEADYVAINRHMLEDIGATVFRLKNFIDFMSID